MMRYVGSDNDIAALGLDPYRLQTFGMAADVVQAYPREKVVVTVVKANPSRENTMNHRYDILHLVSMIHGRVAHAAPRREGHLRVLNMKAGSWEKVVIAGMVVVHVGDDYIFNFRSVDSQGCQAFRHRPE